MATRQKKILTVEFESAIPIVLERSFCDNSVAFYDLANSVKKMWLQSLVATTVAIHYPVISWWEFDLETQDFQNRCIKVYCNLQSEKFVAKSPFRENYVAFRIPQISFHAIQS